MLDPPPFPPRGHAQAELSKARETIVLLTEEIEALHGRDAADLPGASLRQQLGSWRAQFIVAEVSGLGSWRAQFIVAEVSGLGSWRAQFIVAEVSGWGASWGCTDAALEPRLWACLWLTLGLVC